MIQVGAVGGHIKAVSPVSKSKSKVCHLPSFCYSDNKVPGDRKFKS